MAQLTAEQAFDLIEQVTRDPAKNTLATGPQVFQWTLLDPTAQPIEKRPVGLDPAQTPPKLGSISTGDQPQLHAGKIDPQQITLAEWWARQATALAVMLAESGHKSDGRWYVNTTARCFNIDDPATGRPTCSPTGPAGPRGTDRGVYQFNDKAWPMITDTDADTPDVAVRLAALITNGWRDWGPWGKSRGMDPESDPGKAAIKIVEDRLGVVIDKGLFGLPGETAVYDAITGASLGVLDLVSKLVSIILNPAFWRRIGVGVLGGLIIVAALVLTVKG